MANVMSKEKPKAVHGQCQRQILTNLLTKTFKGFWTNLHHVPTSPCLAFQSNVIPFVLCSFSCPFVCLLLQAYCNCFLPLPQVGGKSAYCLNTARTLNSNIMCEISVLQLIQQWPGRNTIQVGDTRSFLPKKPWKGLNLSASAPYSWFLVARRSLTLHRSAFYLYGKYLLIHLPSHLVHTGDLPVTRPPSLTSGLLCCCQLRNGSANCCFRERKRKSVRDK